MCIGVDASHGYERTHEHAIQSVAELLALYMQSEAVVQRDSEALGSIEGFTDQPVEDVSGAETQREFKH